VHSFRNLAYFLFYASYVSATIHVRIAAQRHVETSAYKHLNTCLTVFDVNEKKNPAVKKAKSTIQKLMDRMGVTIPSKEEFSSNSGLSGEQTISSLNDISRRVGEGQGLSTGDSMDLDTGNDLLQGWGIRDLDFEAILQSFGLPDVSVDPAVEDEVAQSAQKALGPKHVLFGFDTSSPESQGQHSI